MPLHPALLALQRRLQQIGTVAVDNPDHLEIRLPLFCTVRVSYDGNRMRLEPYFGATKRGNSTMITTALVAVGIPAIFLTAGATPFTFSLAFLALGSRIYEVTRYVLTEATITRVQLLAASITEIDPRLIPDGSVPNPALRDASHVDSVRQPVSADPESINR